jgi:hypothetical protein
MNPIFAANTGLESVANSSISTSSLLPDELVDRIISLVATIPHELDIIHPADGYDPLFNSILIMEDEYIAEWESLLTTRAALVRVSRQFWRIATPFLYSSFFISRTSPNFTRSEKFVSTIENNPRHAGLVRRLNFDADLGSSMFYGRLCSSCHNLIILDSCHLLDITLLPKSLRVLRSWHELTLSPLILKSLLRLQNLELLVLSCESYEDDASVRASNETLESGFTHFPQLRTVMLEGQLTLEMVQLILHPDGPIQALGIRSFSPHISYSAISHLVQCVTHVSVRDLSVQLNENSQSLLPRLQHLKFTSPYSIHILGVVTKIELDSIRTLAMPFGSRSYPSQVLKWAVQLVKRLGANNNEIRGSSPLKVWYTDGGWLSDQTSFTDLVLLRQGMEALAEIGIDWVVQTGFELTPMKDILTKYCHASGQTWPIQSQD